MSKGPQKTCKISAILERVKVPVEVDPEKTYQEIGIRSHGKGLFVKKPILGIDLGNKSVFWVQANCLILNIVFAWEQAVARTTEFEVGLIASHRFPMYRVDENKVYLDYLLYFFKSTYGKYLLELASPGGAGRNKTLGQGEFSNISIPLPSLSTQIRLSKILLRWDYSTNLTEKLIVEKQQLRKGLMQQLLTGKHRLPGFDGEWREVQLEEIFHNRKETGRIDLPLVAITSKRGVISRNEIGRKDSSSKDKSKYLRICPGDIGYNTMRMWQGVSGLSSIEGIVSPAYTIVTPREGICGEFMAILFKSAPVIHLFYRYSQGMVSDTWNLKFHHFTEIKVTIPNEDEQVAISNIFKTVDRELELLQVKAEALREQKKGLMQQLLTGKVRVKM